MDEHIGRVRSTSVWERSLEERFRAYRFPRSVSAFHVYYYVPNTEYGMCDAWITRVRRKNLPWYEKVNQASMRMSGLDVRRVQVRGRSKIMRIELCSGPKIIDYGNRWDRIEAILEETFSLPIKDLSRPRLTW